VITNNGDVGSRFYSLFAHIARGVDAVTQIFS